MPMGTAPRCRRSSIICRRKCRPRPPPVRACSSQAGGARGGTACTATTPRPPPRIARAALAAPPLLHTGGAWQRLPAPLCLGGPTLWAATATGATLIVAPPLCAAAAAPAAGGQCRVRRQAWGAPSCCSSRPGAERRPPLRRGTGIQAVGPWLNRRSTAALKCTVQGSRRNRTDFQAHGGGNTLAQAHCDTGPPFGGNCELLNLIEP